MAEGGPSPDSHAFDVTQPVHPESQFLECPICLEQLRQPRSLPCHHSFCEECLSSYIVSEVSVKSDTVISFTCPVCRKLTHPLDASENKEKWAKQFPIDSVAMDMIQIRNKHTETYFCMPCQKTKDDNVPAKFWCKTIDCLLCETCRINFHDVIHTNCDVIDVETSRNFPLRQQTFDKRCNKHNKKISYYCEDHKSLGCSKCITVDHRKCEEVTTTEGYCEKLNRNSGLENRKTCLQEAAVALESVINDFNAQLQTIADDKDLALKSIDDLQERLEKRIRETKKEITDDLIMIYKKEKEKLKVSSQKCERLKVAIQNTLELSVTALQRKDHMGTLLLYQRGETELNARRDLLKEVRMSVSTINIRHEADSSMTGIDFGDIVVRKQRRHFKNVPTLSKPLSECDVKEVRKIGIGYRTDKFIANARGVVFITDGIVVGDNSNRKLKLINTEGDIVDELKLNGRPCDLCMVDNTTVAAAVDGPHGIHIVTVTPSKLRLSHAVKTGKPCHGIAYRDGEFVVSLGSEISSVTKDGILNSLYKFSNHVFALSYDCVTGNLFIPENTGTTGNTAVGRLTSNNKYGDFLKVGLVKDAYGVDVDMEGNVYVCGQDSNNIVQISEDGINVRELLTKEHGIRPLSIAVCGDRFVVTQSSFIHLFQLQ
ncbi:uncharacterized protein LOC132564862 [Ylistrum balloti]|uniref:uncharacterized protein LOC132564862 n=1 Tax=Ylistrum balloti TaxID=509963 RepID=UPI002905CB7D|nr:uncharacterized protein LOC132564862 [Ylistrum balloti]